MSIYPSKNLYIYQSYSDLFRHVPHLSKKLSKLPLQTCRSFSTFKSI